MKFLSSKAYHGISSHDDPGCCAKKFKHLNCFEAHHEKRVFAALQPLCLAHTSGFDCHPIQKALKNRTPATWSSILSVVAHTWCCPARHHSHCLRSGARSHHASSLHALMLLSGSSFISHCWRRSSLRHGQHWQHLHCPCSPYLHRYHGLLTMRNALSRR